MSGMTLTAGDVFYLSFETNGWIRAHFVYIHFKCL